MKPTRQLFTKRTALALAIASSAPGLYAQPQTQAGGAIAIEEVVVTATKRETSVQDTAIAMSVFTGDTLKDNGISQVEDLAAMAPGVTFTKNSANVIVSIRGVNSQDTNETGNPAVAIAQDGFYIERANSFSNALFDMERVEVLRGPQGTLYGKNATGGVINFITQKPQSEFEGSASIGLGNYDALNTEGMLNVPLSDRVNARAAFMTREHDGYRTNEAPARAGDDADMTSGRIHLDYTPTDKLYLLLSAQFTTLGGVGPTVTGIPLDVGNDDTVPDLDRRGTPHGLPSQFLDHDYQTYQLNIDYDLEFMNVTYLGGIRNSDYKQRRDLDGTTRSDRYFDLSEDVKDVSHEIRFTSSTAGPLDWQLGANYFKETNDLFSNFQDYSVADAPASLMWFDFDVESKSKAVFAHTTYALADNLTLELGARYSEDEISRVGEQLIFGSLSVFDNFADSSKTTYHAGLNWNMTEDIMTYAKFSTGYKAGGFNNVPELGEANPYDPETLEALEIGVKALFADGKLQLNLAAFTYDYQDQQVSVRRPDGLSSIINAGESEVNGFEMDLVANLTAADRINGSLVILDAEYSDFCTALGAGGACIADFSGNKLTQTPENQIGLGYEHDFVLPGGTLTARAQTHYETESYLGFQNLGHQRKDEFTRSDVILTYRDETQDWSLQGYIRNIENEVVITSAGKSGLFGSYSYGLSAPRTYGVKLTYNW